MAVSRRTESGSNQRFKSCGERAIAGLLAARGLGYFYEHPLAVIAEGKTRIWYPDFQLPDYGLLIEYFGRPDDPAYAAGMAKKRRVYQDNGLPALLLTPAALERADWQQHLLDRIEGLLVGQLEEFRDARRRRREGTRGQGESGGCHTRMLLF